MVWATPGVMSEVTTMEYEQVVMLCFCYGWLVILVHYQTLDHLLAAELCLSKDH